MRRMIGQLTDAEISEILSYKKILEDEWRPGFRVFNPLTFSIYSKCVQLLPSLIFISIKSKGWRTLTFSWLCFAATFTWIGK